MKSMTLHLTLRHLSLALVLCAALFLTSPASAQVPGDDTLSCLSGAVADIEVSRNFGYNNYSNRNASVGTLFDMRGSTWQTQQVPQLRNDYPIAIGDASNGCFIGGVVDGTTPESTDWRERYGHEGNAGGNSAGAFIEDASNFTFTGMRMENVWDGIRANRINNNFIIKNNWIEGYDDCVENDGLKSGVIEDNLFDGCFVFKSSRAGSNATVNSSTAANEVVRVQNNLVYMQAIVRDGGREEGNIFKVSGGAGGPKYAINNNLFLHYGMKSRNTDGSLASITSAPSGKIASCSGNVMIWLGSGAFPGSWPSGCLEVVTGQEGRDLWAAARTNWINCHPEVDRLPSDPESDPSQCDPDAWGGGGTEVPGDIGTIFEPEEPVDDTGDGGGTTSGTSGNTTTGSGGQQESTESQDSANSHISQLLQIIREVNRLQRIVLSSPELASTHIATQLQQLAVQINEVFKLLR